MRTLMLSPEAPYPLHGGGAYRTASLLHYLARISETDLILFSESGSPALLPPGLVRDQQVICLPRNSNTSFARYLRNARRAFLGIPPLVDRLRGFDTQLERMAAGKQYEIGVIEHFWCAPYVELLSRFCGKVVLDLHNVESVLHERCATFSHGAVKAGHRRFAQASRKLEIELLPRFSLVLTPSETDAQTIRGIAPQTRVEVYPNAFPLVPIPGPIEKKRPAVIFSANFEYHPNIDAVEFLASEIWPEVRRRHPELILRLVGRGDAAIRRLVKPGAGIEITGPIEDAFAEIAQGTIVIAPLRAGSGTRLKIIEAWAAARPVVATPLAAEGLDARHGENLLLASTALEIASAVDWLLAEPTLGKRLGAAGRSTFECSYSWEAAWRELDLTCNS